jgi:hypothetical protein
VNSVICGALAIASAISRRQQEEVMRYAKQAITLVMGLAIIGGTINAAAAEEFHGTYRHSYRVHDSYRSGDRDRDWRTYGEHRDYDRGIRPGSEFD